MKQAPTLFSERLFRLLVRSLPKAHRRRFGEDMVRMFREGMHRRWSYFFRACWDVLGAAVHLHLEGMRRTPLSRTPSRIPHKKGTSMFSNWLFDCRQALRSIGRSPGFAVMATLMLGIGIGATVTAFSVIHTVMLRPLPFHRPQELVQLWESNPDKGWDHQTAAPANYLDWLKRNQVFTDIAAYSSFGQVAVERDGGATMVGDGNATGNLFRVLGVQPYLGRLFRPEETWNTAQPVVVLGYPYWKSQFGGDREVIGKTLRLNGAEHEIVGVAPPGFRMFDANPELWRPFRWDPAVFGVAVWTRRAHWIHPVARLKTGVGIQQANDDLIAIMTQLEQEHPETNIHMMAGATPLRQFIAGDTALPLTLLMAAVASLLLIACANTANLALVRALNRSRDLAMRRALGAGRRRLIGMLVTESAALALVGGAIGLGTAQLAVRYLRESGPEGVPRLWELQIGIESIVFCVAVAFASVLVFGVLPAWAASREDLLQGLRSGGEKGARSGSKTASRLRLILAGLQVGLSVAVVLAAGMVSKSFLNLRSVDAGFNPENAVSFKAAVPSGYNVPRAIDFYNRLIDRIEAMPGVDSAAAISELPIRDSTWSTNGYVEGGGEHAFVQTVWHRTVTAGYFSHFGKVVEGRDFDSTDVLNSARVILVNEAFARAVGAPSLIGLRMKTAKPDEEGTWRRIVGIVGDQKHASLREGAVPQIYEVYAQDPRNDMAIVAKVSTPGEGLLSTMRTAVAEIDPATPIFDAESLDRVLADAVARDRFLMIVCSLFAGASLLMAVLGVFSVTAFALGQRTFEFGVRTALGAQPQDLVRLGLSFGWRTILVGIAAGLAASAVFSGTLTTLLYGVSPFDPLSFLMVPLLLAAVTLTACLLPARRASRVDVRTMLVSE